MRTKNETPREWANTQYNLALARADLAELRPDEAEALLQQAKEGFLAAAEAYDDCGIEDEAAEAREKAQRVQAKIDALGAK
ncbi:MAG: hypothetical protein ACE5JM_12050 [Armatimonadota bacterium]